MQEPLSCFARCSALPGVWEEQECSGEGQQLEAVRGWGWEGRGWMELHILCALSRRNTPENHEYRGDITAENKTPFQL